MRAAILLAAFLAVVPASAADNDSVRSNYLLACRGCHLEDGRGIPPEVPSLRDTLGGFMASGVGRAYLLRVPGVAGSRLGDRELAEVMNWVLTEFNAGSLPADFAPFSAAEVAAARDQVLANPLAYRTGLIEGLASE